MKKKGGRGGVGGGRRAGRRLGRGVGIDWGRAGPPVRQTALVRTKHGFEKSRSTPRKKTAMLNFAFAYSPSSARRRLFKMALPLLMADMVRSFSGCSKLYPFSTPITPKLKRHPRPRAHPKP